jgi:hypothetical protein
MTKINKLSQSNIKDLTKYSRQTISKVINGNDTDVKPEVSERILGLLKLEGDIMELFMHEDFYEMCKVALIKSPSNNKNGFKIRMLAVSCMRASEILRNTLKPDSINDEVSKL